ncbi:MAG TPA: RedB protein [Blastocatellia bacterium]|nr:RedB protein [Blastocatellia bacterium]
MRLSGKSKVFLFVGIAGWLLAVGVGLRLILVYENTPGRSAASSAEWPADSEIPRTPGMPTLVTMVHPHCPCSCASVAELAVLMVRAQGLVNANVLFVKPKDFPEEWEKTDLWSSAAMIPGVNVRVDDEGVEAGRFGSQTSGQIMLYSADGKLLFSGGITSSRGHSGDNDGRSAIISFLTNGSAAQRETPVFGCPLFSDPSNEGTEDSCHAVHHN